MNLFLQTNKAALARHRVSSDPGVGVRGCDFRIMKLKMSSAIGWLTLVIGLQIAALQGEETDRALTHNLTKWANLAVAAFHKGSTFLNNRNEYSTKQQVDETDGDLEVEENVVGDSEGGSALEGTSQNTAQSADINSNGPAPSLAQQAILTTIATTAAVVTLYESVYRRVGPQDTTPDDVLEAVKRIEAQMGGGFSQSQFKTAEDTITRAQHDMSILGNGNGPIGKRYGATDQESEGDAGCAEDLIHQFQSFLWLERAREVDGYVIVIMKGLLGQQAGAADLMEAISRSTNCDAVAIPFAVNRYLDRVREASRIIEFYAKSGQMSEEEVHERRALFWAYHAQVAARLDLTVQQCLHQQLEIILRYRRKEKTDHVAKRIASRIAARYPLPTRWIIAVYRDQDMTPIPALVRADIKPRLSGGYVIHEGDLHVALYPFPEGNQPMMIDGTRIDEFCSRRIPGAGDDNTQCDVGSSDGEFIYDQLRRQGAVPPQANLIVVPTSGELSLKMVPEGSLNPFLFKSYPDFHIMAF